MKLKLWRIVTMVAVLLAASWLLAAPMPPFVRAQDAEDVDEPELRRTVSVSGTGQASATPDLAVVSLGVQTQAEEAGEALLQNSEQMQAVIDALKEAGVEAQDIQTQVIRLSPRYEQPTPQTGRTQQGPPELVGFVATNIIEVMVRDLDDLGDLLDAAIQAGGNQIQGIRFEVEDPAELFDQAREAAWEDATHKAEQLAELSDSELGVVLTINESSRTPRPGTERVLSAGAAAAVPIEPGTQLIEINLQVTWLLTAPASEAE
jgi:uncharacterized protein YggE